MTPTVIVLSLRYADDSGVEYSVSYNGDNLLDDQITIKHHGAEVMLPFDKLEWLMEALRYISYEVKP